MQTYTEGDWVQEKSNPRLYGQVTYVEDELVYFETPSGVEMEFKVSALEKHLTEEEKAQLAQEAIKNDNEQAFELVSCLEFIMNGKILDIAHAVYLSTASTFGQKMDDDWHLFTPTQKMHWVYVASSTREQDWLDALATGGVSKMALTAIVMIGDNVSRGIARLGLGSLAG